MPSLVTITNGTLFYLLDSYDEVMRKTVVPADVNPDNHSFEAELADQLGNPLKSYLRVAIRVRDVSSITELAPPRPQL